MSDQNSKSRAIGDLTFDSPGVWDILKRRTDSKGLQRIWTAYALAAKAGALNDAPVRREPGASFNPRPARLLHILLNETPLCSLDTLVAAIFASLRSLDPPCAPDFGVEWETARRALTCEPSSSDENTLGIRLALLLDEIRHLHMTSLSAKERATVLESAGMFLNNFSRSPTLSRLHELTVAALDRSLRSGKR